MTENMIGSYGEWAADLVGRGSGAFSLRSGRFNDVDAWRIAARGQVWNRLAAPPLPAATAQLEAESEFEGLSVELLSWQLPYGPRTEAVFLKPAGARGPLPGVLALHDHGGLKYFGWRKIAQVESETHPIIVEHRNAYGGLAWANEIARRGYAVLVPDTFVFGSRRVRLSDVPEGIRGGVRDPGPDELSEEIAAYNRWAADHEHLMAKSLFSAGTTWPALFLRDDQAALGILASRPDVDSNRLACGGLSGGGLRTVFLAGMDERVRSCFCAGFFTTWIDFLLYKCYTHTWMTYLPLLPRDLDFSEILGLRAPSPTLVLHCTEDPLFTNSEVQIAGEMLRDVYLRAGAPDSFRLATYPGGHQFNREMQAEAFDWLDRTLGVSNESRAASQG